MSDNHPQLGKLIGDTEQRDAIHMAVVPVIAHAKLEPCQKIGFVNGDDKARRVEVVSKDPIGIVDPYLTRPVFPGEQFWMFMFPGTVSKLRHDWTHPAFSETSVEWLEELANEMEVGYQELIDAGHRYIDEGHYAFGSDDAKDILNNNKHEFFTHFEVITGRKLHKDIDEVYFSCAC